MKLAPEKMEENKRLGYKYLIKYKHKHSEGHGMGFAQTLKSARHDARLLHYGRVINAKTKKRMKL